MPSLLKTFEIKYEAPEVLLKARYIVGARSYFMNSRIPQLEVLVVPPRRLPAATARLFFNDTSTTSLSVQGRRRRALAAVTRPLEMPSETPAIDLRKFGMENWSHALNQAIPIALMARDKVREHGGDSLLAVVPENISSKILGMLKKLDFDYLQTNKRLRAHQVIYEELDGRVTHYHSRDWLKPHQKQIREMIGGGDQGLPKKVFIDRRGSRNLENVNAVRNFLSERGFQAIYAEDLSLEKQFQLVILADEIVAIHGAALAPLLYRTADDGPLRLVEILSPGHVNFFSPGLMRDLPVDYRALRGIPKAGMCADAYQIDRGEKGYASKHAYTPFAVDLAGLEVALRAERVEELLQRTHPLEVYDP